LHRAEAVSWRGRASERDRILASPFCWRCRKLALRTRDDAHAYIGILITSGPRDGRDWQLRPYRCPKANGCWHVGHDRSVVRLIHEFRQRERRRAR
jgi:hypothetical protein